MSGIIDKSFAKTFSSYYQASKLSPSEITYFMTGIAGYTFPMKKANGEPISVDELIAHIKPILKQSIIFLDQNEIVNFESSLNKETCFLRVESYDGTYGRKYNVSCSDFINKYKDVRIHRIHSGWKMISMNNQKYQGSYELKLPKMKATNA